MPFSCAFLGQLSLFNLMKNVNQLQTELKCRSYDSTLQAGDMETIDYLPASSLIFGISYLPFLIILNFSCKIIRKVRPSTICHGNLKTEPSL